MAPLEVPSVTWEELRSFHQNHFLNAPLPTSIPSAELQQTEDYYDDDDDGLGYYPDGAKRTLTDEEIAIFRHSEWQRILKQVRVRVAELEAAELEAAELEAAECTTGPMKDGEEVAEPSERQATTISPLDKVAPQVQSGASPASPIPAVTGEAAVSLKRKREADEKDDSNVASVVDAQDIDEEPPVQDDTASILSSEVTTATRSDFNEAAQGRRRKKKKNRRKKDPFAPRWHDKNEFVDESDQNGHTFRRKAREEDEQKAEIVELDY